MFNTFYIQTKLFTGGDHTGDNIPMLQTQESSRTKCSAVHETSKSSTLQSMRPLLPDASLREPVSELTDYN